MNNLMWEEKKLKWKKSMSAGNQIIDSENRNLISLVNDAIRALETNDSSGLALAFEQIEYGLRDHFANEEKLAQAVGFDFSNTRMIEQYELKELLFLRDELVGGAGSWSEEGIKHFTRFLENWMINENIIGLDMRMKPVLQKYDYNFWPGRECDESTRGMAVISGAPKLVSVHASA